MKKERKCRNSNLELYKKLDEANRFEDTRYWGLFRFGTKGDYHYKIDPKRFSKMNYHHFEESQLRIINSRETHYFFPKKRNYSDYNCNVIIDEIKSIKDEWYNTFKGLIQREQERIQKPKKLVAADDYNFMCGVTEYDESEMWAMRKNMENSFRYQRELYSVTCSLYAQFIHQMASRIEAITVYVLARNGKNVKHFDRIALYDYSCAQGTARDFEHYPDHDKLYCIWHFLKHNSISTYDKLKEKYPEVLVDGEFKQGYLASTFVKYSEELIISLLDGCSEFFKEYCAVVYHENYAEAQWNYDSFFANIVDDNIDMIVDPFGLKYY